MFLSNATSSFPVVSVCIGRALLFAARCLDGGPDLYKSSPSRPCGQKIYWSVTFRREGGALVHTYQSLSFFFSFRAAWVWI